MDDNYEVHARAGGVLRSFRKEAGRRMLGSLDGVYRFQGGPGPKGRPRASTPTKSWRTGA